MANSVDLAVLKAHRSRVAMAKNFQEFQEAQLDLLDYMITIRPQEEVLEEATRKALDGFAAKYNEWCTK